MAGPGTVDGRAAADAGARPAIEPAVLLVAAPPVAVTLVCAALAILGLIGIHPFWPRTPVTLPEAVAYRAGWEVLRQVGSGSGLDVAATVRRGIVPAGAADLTAWEAAIAAGQPDVLDLLVREGHRPGPDAARRAVCLGRALGREQELLILADAGVLVDQPCEEP